MAVNADYCRWCGLPITVQESGEWGHTRIGPGTVMRFWCNPPFVERVEPLTPHAEAS